MLIELNRPQIDIGLFTNRIEEMKAFYGGTLGLHSSRNCRLASPSRSIAISRMDRSSN